MVRGLPDSIIYGTYKRLAHLGKKGSPPALSGRVSAPDFRFTFKFQGVVFRQPQFEVYKNAPEGGVGKYLRDKGKSMMAASKVQVGVDSGALRRSIGMIHSRGMLGQTLKIGSPLNYALVHHEGSRPHIITPRDAGILRFSAGGRMIYTHKVEHPGTKPNRYLSDQLWMVRL